MFEENVFWAADAAVRVLGQEWACYGFKEEQSGWAQGTRQRGSGDELMLLGGHLRQGGDLGFLVHFNFSQQPFCCFPTMVDISTNSVRGFPFLHILHDTCYCFGL